MTVDLSGSANLPDPGALDAAAHNLVLRIDLFADSVEDIHGSWSGGLAQAYKAPEQEEVYTVLAHPKDTVQALRVSAQSAATALRSFAQAAENVIARRNSLIETSEAHADPQVSAGDPELYEQNFQLEADMIASEYAEAEDACIKALNALQRNTTNALAAYAPKDPDAEINQATNVYNRLVDGRSTDPQADLATLLQRLDLMTPEEISQFMADNPLRGIAAVPSGLDPAANKELWASLRHPEVITAVLPLLVGNLEGLPYRVRAEGNRAALVAAAGQPNLTQEQIDAYASITDSLETADEGGVPERFLIAFDPDVIPPLAAVSVGDVDTADYVTVNVPGMEATTTGMNDWTNAAQSLYNAQTRVDSGSGHAVIAWMNYSTPGAFPDSSEVLHTDMARAGAKRLAESLTGIHTVVGEDAFLTVGAHSYGTPTAGNGLAEIDFKVDAAILYASAGMDPSITPDADSLQVKQDANGNPNVYATTASADELPGRGILGTNLAGDWRVGAADPLFGSKIFGSDGNGVLAPTSEHTAYTGRTDPSDSQGYLDPGTQSLESIAQISMGRGSKVDVMEPLDLDSIEHLKLRDPQLFGPRM